MGCYFISRIHGFLRTLFRRFVKSVHVFFYCITHDWTGHKNILRFMNGLKKSVVLGALLISGLIALSSWKSSETNNSNGGAWYTCDRCDGSGHDPVVKCRTCGGRGTVEQKSPCRGMCSNGQIRDQYGNWVNCPLCGGTGYETSNGGCPSCDGWGGATCTKCNGSRKVWRN